MTDENWHNEPERSGSTAEQHAALRDVISILNTRSTSELDGLSSSELVRLEALCEVWSRRAYLERMRRSGEPQTGSSS
jgi:hypothetical protein